MFKINYLKIFSFSQVGNYMFLLLEVDLSKADGFVPCAWFFDSRLVLKVLFLERQTIIPSKNPTWLLQMLKKLTCLVIDSQITGILFEPAFWFSKGIKRFFKFDISWYSTRVSTKTSQNFSLVKIAIRLIEKKKQNYSSHWNRRVWHCQEKLTPLLNLETKTDFC